jgi:putative endonuclease
MTKQSFGKTGEEIARDYLERQGYQILDTNFRTRFGEIDIVAREGDIFVFVEVKARRGISFGLPEEAVTFRKQNKIIRMGLWYLREKHMEEVSWRIDVISIIMPLNREPKIKLIKNAVER